MTKLQEYKVVFENNKPAFANLLTAFDYKNLIKFTRHGNKKFIQWLVVPGRNEKDAIQIADKVVNDFWAKFLA